MACESLHVLQKPNKYILSQGTAFKAVPIRAIIPPRPVTSACLTCSNFTVGVISNDNCQTARLHAWQNMDSTCIIDVPPVTLLVTHGHHTYRTWHTCTNTPRYLPTIKSSGTLAPITQHGRTALLQPRGLQILNHPQPSAHNCLPQTTVHRTDPSPAVLPHTQDLNSDLLSCHTHTRSQ